jgi:hypothetical protein
MKEVKAEEYHKNLRKTHFAGVGQKKMLAHVMTLPFP